MSTPARAPADAVPEFSRAAHGAHTPLRRVSFDVILGAALAAALILFSFVTGGGADLGSATWTEVALVSIGCAAAAALLLYAPGRGAPGTASVCLFAALCALTALSITWSVAPESSWQETDRLLSLLAAFAAAVVGARLFPERWRAVLGGIATFCVLLSVYALAVKVFPGTLDHDDTIGRLKAPFDYWNATGLLAALGLAPTVWAGAREEGGRPSRALSVPGIAVMVAVLVLSYSRSALLAALCGLALWFWLVPLRLRGAMIVALGGAGGAVISLWALHTHALTHDRVALAARSDAGQTFGIVLVVVLGLCAAAGLLAAVGLDRTRLPPATRRRVGIALISLVGLVPLAGIAGLAVSSRGLTGQISHAWRSLTDANGVVGDNAGRLVDLSNSRPRYWREGIQIGAHNPLHGAGAASYAVARLRFARDTLPVGHAHSYPIETFADLGGLGLAVNLALLIGWGLAARRTLRRDADREPDLSVARFNERAALLTLLCPVVAFGAQSSVDWTWSISGAALPALLCAGWLAGRGPAATGSGGGRVRRRRVSEQPLLGAACTGIVAAGLMLAWVIWQPLRSSDADNTAVAALSRGDAPAALSAARAAVAEDPLAVEPLWVLADVRIAVRDSAGARSALEQATRLQPQNAATWQELGDYEIAHGQGGLAALLRAHGLDPTNVSIDSALRRAQAQSARARRRR